MENELLSFLNKNKFFSENQFGFLKGQPMEGTILKLKSRVTGGIYNGKWVILRCYLSLRNLLILIFHLNKNAGSV